MPGSKLSYRLSMLSTIYFNFGKLSHNYRGQESFDRYRLFDAIAIDVIAHYGNELSWRYEFGISMQLFFVYDTSYCKTERDDPRDAIVYFYPPQISEPQRCTICCQLVGMVQFFQSTFSCPKIITLQKGKFAIKLCSSYLLALEANSSVPDIIITKQLESLYSIFCFYHKDIDRICKMFPNNRSAFLQRMEEIWNCCFPASRAFNNDVLVTFSAVPTVIIPEAVSALINIQALQLLQSCQRHCGVVAGCIFFKHRMLFTQFNTEISRFLTLVKFLQDNFSPEDVTVPFQLPPGIRIIRVFIQKNTLCQITCSDHYYGKHKTQNPETPNGYASKEITSGSEGDIDSDADGESSASSNSSCGMKKVTHAHLKKGISSSVRRKCNMEDPSSHHHQNHDKKESYRNENSNSDVFCDTQCDIGQSFQLHKASASTSEDVNVSTEDCHEIKNQHERSSQSDKSSCDTVDTLQEMCLFIQSYLNCIVIFLMEPKFIYNINLMQSLWGSGLSVLSELEVLIQCHMQEPSKENPKSYSFLCLENQGRTLNGFPPPESYEKEQYYPQFKTIQHIHGDFENNPHLFDMSTVANNTMIHAHRSPVHEAFYHQVKHESDSFPSYFTSLGSLPVKAVRRLEKQLGIFLP